DRERGRGGRVARRASLSRQDRPKRRAHRAKTRGAEKGPLLRTVAIALAAGLFAAAPPQSPAPAPSQQSTRMVLRGRAPVSHDVLNVKLPRPQEADLSNGLHLMVLEDRKLPQISFTIIIPGA